MGSATSPSIDRYFSTDHLDADLGRRALRGGAVTVASQGCRFALNLASTALLARLLNPRDFGLVAMVLVVTGFAHLFRDLGLSMATVQRREVTQAQVSTLFWLNGLLGFLMMLLTSASAPVVAWFYGEPRLTHVTIAISSSFVFIGFSAQHQALVTRQMRFAALAMNEVLSLAAGIAAALVAALLGAGYWALVLMQVTTAVTSCCAWWIQCRWRPGLPEWARDTPAMLAFGGHLTGFNVVNFLARNVDNVLVGRFCGSYQLGLYSKAYQLLLLPVTQINGPMTRVAVPALSRLQNDPERFRRYYRRAILLLCAVSMPVVALLFSTADQAIALVLGKGWLEAVPLFQLLAPAAFIGTFHVATGWVYVSLGQTDRQLKMGVVVTAVTLIAFGIGTAWGAAGVAAACSIAACLTRYPTIVYCFRTTPLRPRDLLGAIWRPALIALGSAAVVYAIRRLTRIDALPVSIAFAVSAAVYAASYAAMWQLFPEGRGMLKSGRALLDDLLDRRRPAGAAAALPTVPPVVSAGVTSSAT